jgi:hydrogenase maturation protein HypF
VPTPVLLNRRFDKPVLAVGAELKNTICVATGEAAYLSQHIGDLENLETYRVFVETIRRFLKILDLRPALIAHDLHPAYLSTQFVLDPPPDFDWVLESLKMPVQHHHAHVASCLAEKGLRGKVIGVALDGTGYGEDGTIWGGEVLVADLQRAERCAHLEQVALPGGDLAIREPWRMALAYIQAVFGDAWRDHLPPALKRISEQKLIVTISQLQSSTLLPLTSSCGRLFDALAALSGVCLAAAYEGQPAIEFEQALEPGTIDCYPFTLNDRSGTIVIGWREMIRAAVRDLQAGKAASLVSDRFHRGLIEALTGTVTTIAARTGIRDVVLTGGCFMNMTLLEGMINNISGAGLNPVIHERVPCNDGGIALGQAAVAAARTG